MDIDALRSDFVRLSLDTYSIVRYSRDKSNLITPNMTGELLDQILASHKDCFPSIMVDDLLTSLFLGELCVYMKNSVYVGHLTIDYDKRLSDLAMVRPNIPDIHCNIIWNVCVNNRFRGSGICNSMIKKAMNRKSIYALLVLKDNVGAIKCYKKNGFSMFSEDDTFIYMKTADVILRVGKREQELAQRREQELAQRRKHAEGEIKIKNKKNRKKTFTRNRFTLQRRVVCRNKLRVMILIISHGDLVSGRLEDERRQIVSDMISHRVNFGGITPAFQRNSISYPVEVANSDKSQYVNIDLIAAGCNYSTLWNSHIVMDEIDTLMDDATTYDFSKGSGTFVDMLNATQTECFNHYSPVAAPQLTPRIISVHTVTGQHMTLCDKPFKHSSDWPGAFGLPKSNKIYEFLTEQEVKDFLFTYDAPNGITFTEKLLGQYNTGMYTPDTPIVKFYFTHPLTGYKYVGVAETYNRILLTEIINRVHFQVNTLLGPICKDIPINYVVTDTACSAGPLGSEPALGGKKRQNNQTKKSSKKSKKNQKKYTIKIYNKSIQ